MHAKALTDFYTDILAKNNQSFLCELIDQSTKPQVEGGN